MPKLNSPDMETNSLTGHYGFSATKIDNLGATEYTLVDIVVDSSGSVAAFQTELEDCIKEVINSCKMSPRADNLMVRLVEFNKDVGEIHGYKLLEHCNLDDYSNVLRLYGTTALFDASENSVLAQTAYAKDLVDNDFSVNSIVVVITDGADNVSHGSAADVKKALATAVKEEAVESMVSILIGVNPTKDRGLSDYLDSFKTDAGFTQYEEIDKADSKTLAKLAQFISRSISAQSSSLGTGGHSKPQSFTI